MDVEATRTEAIRLRVQGYSWATVADSLNRRGFATPSGAGRWWPSSAQRFAEPGAAAMWAAYMRAYRGR